MTHLVIMVSHSSIWLWKMVSDVALEHRKTQHGNDKIYPAAAKV